MVVVFAGELLAKADHLLRMGLHVADVVEGYEVALRKALELLEGSVAATLNNPTSDKALLKNALLSAISSKQHGYENFLGDLVVQAATDIMPPNPKAFNVDSVRVVKILGGSLYDSKVVSGMVFNREPEGDIRKLKAGKVAIYTCALDITQTETKGTVLLKSAGELMDFSKGEEKQLEAVIKSIADSGVKCIVTGSGIGDMALHFVNRYGMMAIKILSKFELRRLCRVTGAVALTKLQAPTPDETGFCDVIEYLEIGGDRCTVFRQESEKSRTATIVLRGSTQNFLDDVERAVDDGVNIVKAVVKDGRMLAGAGACEIELARQIAEFGNQTSGMHSHAVKAFAEALEVVPRALADNAGMDATSVISKLYVAHQNGVVNAGVNVNDEENCVVDVINDSEFPVYDAFAVKFWALKLAADAAVTILKVDQVISFLFKFILTIRSSCLSQLEVQSCHKEAIITKKMINNSNKSHRLRPIIYSTVFVRHAVQ